MPVLPELPSFSTIRVTGIALMALLQESGVEELAHRFDACHRAYEARLTPTTSSVRDDHVALCTDRSPLHSLTDPIHQELTMFISSLRRTAQIALVAASSAAAQSSPAPARASGDNSEWLRRSTVSISFVQSRPQGVFGQKVGVGYGADGAYLLRLDDAGMWSLRANIGVISYGDESRRTALSESVGGRVNVDVKTSNYLIPVSVGPQVAWPTGAVRPYANAGVGGLGFITESHVQGTGDLTSVGSTTNHSSFVGSWVVGGGVYVPLAVRARQIQLDLGVQYFNGGNTRYLAPGSIVDLPGARIAVTPLESVTHTAVMRIGVRVQP
jgi:hypothetical protein